jgi:hypothetical protein
MKYAEFTALPLREPAVYCEVLEGEYMIGDPSDHYDHLVTFGLITCKAISIHNPATERGLLAHLDGTMNLPSLLDKVAEAYDDDLTGTDIKVVQASTDDDTLLWPPIEKIAGYFEQYTPRSLLIDVNETGLAVRGIALNLRTGDVQDVRRTSPAMTESRQILKRSTPLRPME